MSVSLTLPLDDGLAELAAVKIGVEAAGREEGGVGATLGYAALFYE